ncbi:hypothetical protein AM588_10002248 [Phytophthora nicotianae]|uniref:Uncharacterized protein n=1 Tax=Phytophthora nicotianae TaxID=4792 RepID=A0A0W8CZW5_PHYNI|nr:hypothetical protein AM588_10002248 [Phytophthora nicotianae]
MLVEVRQADRKQTQRYYQKLRSETRIPRETRAEIIQDREREAKLRAARSFGNSLRRSTEEIRRFYKKNSEWQRDQTISSIQPSPGHFYAADLPTEERMASEWNHILGISHATVPAKSLAKEFDKFVSIENEKKVNSTDLLKLMEPITEDETWKAINQLERHKSAGTSGLNHDFYKDFSTQLTPSLTRLYNMILKGGGYPLHFWMLP